MRPSRPAVVGAVLVVGALVAGGFLALRAYQPLVHVGETVITGEVQSVVLEDFGGTGSHVLRYEHGASVVYVFTVRNTGPIGVTVTSLPLPDEGQRPLLQPLATGVVPQGSEFSGELPGSAPLEPFALGPGEERDAVVHARFDNCEFYTERAISTVTAHDVGFRVAGVERTATVSLERPLLVRSPTIRRCPGRSMDRSEDRRSEP